MNSRLHTITLALLLFSIFVPGLARAADQVLHLSIGDPARKDREVPLQLDVVTDTKTGEAITPAEIARRLTGVRLLLVGEEHTNMDIHEAQARIIQALHQAGRRVFIGLEMYPYTEQKWLDAWSGGKMGEEEFLRSSRWYENWGYHWNYYRDIFMFARDKRLPMFALNAPREVVAAVRKKGFANLTPEEASHIPKSIDVSNPEHMTFFKATFAGAEGAGPMAHIGANEEMLKSMLAAQATWDATMAYNAVQALKRPGAGDAIMVVLVGSGHVAYGVGIEHQARQWFDGPIASVIPMQATDDLEPLKTVRASYANFLWGLPEQLDSKFPTTGLSTRATSGGVQVLTPMPASLAAKAGFKENDVIVSMDGTPVPDREMLASLSAAKRWGDAAVFVVRRGTDSVTLTMLFRRTAFTRGSSE